MERTNDKQDRNSKHSDDHEVMLYMDDLSPAITTNSYSSEDTVHVHSNGLSVVIDTVDDSEVRRTSHHKNEATPSSPSTIAGSNTSGAGGGNRPRLLETDNNYNPRPTHGPEIDDLVTDDDGESNADESPRRNHHNGHYPGIDDGLLPDHHDEDKVILRYVLQASSGHPYYYPALIMITSSLVLQSVVGMFLIWNSRYNVKDDEQLYKANRSNNWLVIAVFIVTILNVFISSFGVVDIPRYNAVNGLQPLEG
ncbi:hypothetical protein QAD02_005656 [Eretmocerus hayati]|uniref:Uncharacterized protein n=1 Tax=Eretmocerus hayati TaxID=131215 RepID=A0ACC2NT20_9HYME|nr:hypothetical protein QAD02_005656 [Eretmocerus hayati]